MENPKITRFIVEQLGRHRSPGDIVLVICQRTQMNWQQAQALVAQVQAAHQPEIANKKNREYRLMTIICLLLGPLALIGSIVLTLQGHLVFLIQLSMPPVAIPLNLVMFLVGISMSLVGVTGLMKGGIKGIGWLTSRDKK